MNTTKITKQAQNWIAAFEDLICEYYSYDFLPDTHDAYNLELLTQCFTDELPEWTVTDFDESVVYPFEIYTELATGWYELTKEVQQEVFNIINEFVYIPHYTKLKEFEAEELLKEQGE